MFNKLRKQLQELAYSDDAYLLVPAFEIIDKVENRYERYEAALKDIAEDTCNDIYDLRRLAKEVLVSDEELQIRNLRKILADFDKEVIVKVLKDYR